jgi:hypothetical protein
MTEKVKDVEINFFQVLDIFGGVMGKILISAPKERAKSAFKELKQGKVLSVGEINQSEKIKLACKLKLDHTEFKGPGFNYDIFRVALGGLLNQVGAALKAKKDIKIMHSEQGLQLVAIPGVVRANDQDNVLMIALEFAKDASITAHLMFMDPEQFKEAAEQAGDHTAETSTDADE